MKGLEPFSKILALLIFLLPLSGLSPELKAQSYGAIPLDNAKVLNSVQTVDAPNGFKIIDPQGKQIKTVGGPAEVNVKAFVEHGGNLFLMSDWSYDRLINQGAAPNWMLVEGLKPRNNPDPTSTPPEPMEEPDPNVAKFYTLVVPDRNDAQAPILSYVENSQLIYADEEWIIVGKFVRDQSAQGFHHLSAYHTNTLRLAFQLKVINYVYCMDWSPERQQFLAVTTANLGNEMLVKWPEDEPGIILIDLPRQKIERLIYATSSQDRTQWNGDRIVVEYNNDEPLAGDSHRFFTSPFSDVVVEARRASSKIPDLPSRREQYEKDASLDLVGLTNFSEEHHTWYSQVSMDLTSEAEKSFRMIRSTSFGHAIDLDLGELRAKRIGSGLQPIEELSLMDGGVIGLRLNPSTIRFLSPGREIESDLAAYKEESSEIGFSNDSAILVSQPMESSDELTITKVGLDGDIERLPVRLPHAAHKSWASHPKRKSIVTLEYVSEEIAQLWHEYSWETGKRIGEPFRTEIAKGMGPHGRLFGTGEGHWSLHATISDHHTGGYTFSVEALNSRTGETAYLDGREINDSPPLHLFDATSEGFSALCSGNHKVYLYQYRSGQNRASVVREWDKNPGHGDAAFDRVAKRLFMPRENGYEVYTIKGTTVEKAFDLYFHGDKEYAVVLPNGYYAGSPGCESFLSISDGDSDTVAAAALAPWRNRPARVLEALGGDQDAIAALEKVTHRWLQRSGYDEEAAEPTSSDLTRLTLGETLPLRTSQSNFEIPLRIKAGSRAPDRIKVTINGVPEVGLDNLSTIEPGKTLSATIPVSLSPGQNWVELIAITQNKASGEPLRFRIISTVTARPPKRYVVAVGVSEYAIPALNLDLAAKDAEDVSEMFSQLSGVSETETLVLTDSRATADSLAEIEKFLSQSTVNDEVIFFGAAHGILDENLEYVFCTHEFNPEDASGTGIKLDSILDALRKGGARRCLILLDTCQAGFVGERDVQLLARNEGPALNVTSISRSPITSIDPGIDVVEASRYIEEMFLMPGSLEGIHIIGASSAAGFALEIEGILNGVFTSALIEALRQGKADLDSDKEVTIDELQEFLDRRVVELTQGKQQPSIVAEEKDQAMSFPVPR